MIRFLFSIFAVFLVQFVGLGQSNNDVFVEDEFSNYSFGCAISNEVVKTVRFEELNADRKCKYLRLPKNVDFKKFSLITYRMSGDCKIQGSTNITLDSENKSYKVHLKNYWGGCRAGGSFGGWLLIDKLPEGFSVIFAETKLDSPKPLSPFSTFALQGLGSERDIRHRIKSSEIDLKGCISIPMRGNRLIASKKEYLAMIRKDAQFEDCRKMELALNFERNAYIGVNLNSGYCRRPKGLKFFVSEFGGSKKYFVNIAYKDPENRLCRALSTYDLWLEVPRPPTAYSLTVRINLITPFRGVLN